MPFNDYGERMKAIAPFMKNMRTVKEMQVYEGGDPNDEPIRKRQPIGLTPRCIHERKVNVQRMKEIFDAIERYANARVNVPAEWLEELKELHEATY